MLLLPARFHHTTAAAKCTTALAKSQDLQGRDVAALRVRRMSLCQRQRRTRICFAAHLLRPKMVPEQKAVPQSCGLFVRVPVLAISCVDVAQILHQRLLFEQACGWVYQAPLAAKPPGNFQASLDQRCGFDQIAGRPSRASHRKHGAVGAGPHEIKVVLWKCFVVPCHDVFANGSAKAWTPVYACHFPVPALERPVYAARSRTQHQHAHLSFRRDFCSHHCADQPSDKKQ